MIYIIRNDEFEKNASMQRIYYGIKSTGKNCAVVSRDRTSKGKLKVEYKNNDILYTIRIKAKYGKRLFRIFNLIKYQIALFFFLIRNRKRITTIHSFDLDTGYVVKLFSFLYRRKYVYHIADFYPEEFNRQAVGLVAKYHFAPTERAKQNLLKEGKDEKTIFVTGNTVIDALQTTVKEEYSHEVIDWAKDSKLILLTAHRRENLGKPMENMFRAINRIVNEHKDIKVIYPIHLNPKVRETANKIFKDNDRVRFIEPLEVLDFHNIMARSYIILTDSGGIQEEAPSLGKPVLVMRDTTERPEGIDTGTLKLVGTDEEKIYKEFKNLLENQEEYERMSKTNNPYGDGNASQRIFHKIIKL